VTIRSEAGNRTLRELAAEFGVSHETVRTVLRLETLSTAA
jgi:DeoR/GlpR family transcriptional regulator of sugar metabolism